MFSQALTEAAFRDAARTLGATVHRYQKTARVAAKPSAGHDTVITYWNGEETRNTAAPGDMIVTSLARDGTPVRDRQGRVNSYVVGTARFRSLYRALGESASDPDLGDLFEARGEIEAFAVPGGFEIMSPWGEMERADSGYIVRNGEDVYGVAAEIFEANYAKVPA